MVAIFSGAGAGLARGSANILGAAGQIGSAVLGRGGGRVSVNAATGNLVVARQDEFLAGRGLDASVSRTYNSLQDTSDRDNGDNWQQSTTRRVFGLTGALNAAGSTVQRLGADGSVVTYAYGDRGGVAAYWATDDAGAHDKLVKSGSSWVWTDGDSQIVETYGVAQAGAGEYRLVRRTDIDGYRLTFSYLAGTDKLDRVTTATGEWIAYHWSPANDRIDRIETGYTDLATDIAATLTRTRYTYDAADRLASVITDLSPEDGSIADQHTYTIAYTYDGSSNRIASISQSDGAHLAIAYDGSGRVVSLTQTVATGQTRVTGLDYGAGHTEVTAADGAVTRLEYAASSALLTRIVAPPAETGASAQEIEFGYDADGNLASVTDAGGAETTYEHDAFGNVTKVVDPLGNEIVRTYDTANHLLQEISRASDPSSSDAVRRTRYAYSGEGHLAFVVDPDGRVAEYAYYGWGGLNRTLQYTSAVYSDPDDPSGTADLQHLAMIAWREGLADRSDVAFTRTQYDERGNLKSVVSYAATNQAGDPVSAHETETATGWIYDQAGRVLAQWNKDQDRQTYVYDGLGRVIVSNDPASGTVSIAFNDADDSSLAGTVVTTTGEGHVVTETYNKAGELLARTSSDPSLTGTETFEYDGLGRLRIATDANGHERYIVYDDAGRKVGEVSDDYRLVEYVYDRSNRIIATVRYENAVPAGQRSALGNADGMPPMDALRPGAHAGDLWNWTIYDDVGRVVQQIDGAGAITAFVYDKANRLVSTIGYANALDVDALNLKASLPTAPVTVTSDAADDMIVRTFYDRAGNVVGQLDGEGYLTRSVYDSAGRVIETIAYANATNPAHRATGTFAQLTASLASADDRRSHLVYDGRGYLRFRIDDVRVPDGQGQEQTVGRLTQFTYDAAGLKTGSYVYAASVSPAAYDYQTVKAAAAAAADTAADRRSYFTYDSAGRLTFTIDAARQVTEYVYDSAGRVVRTTGYANLRYVTSPRTDAWMRANFADNQSEAAMRHSRSYYSESGLLRYAVDPAGYVTEYIYDVEGRVETIRRFDDDVIVDSGTVLTDLVALTAGASHVEQETTYDVQDRVVQTEDAEGAVTRFTYAGNGLASGVSAAFGTGAQADGVTIYDAAGRAIAVIDAHGEVEEVETAFAYDAFGRQTETVDPEGNATGYTYDRRGQLVEVEDAAGNTISYEYNAFGEVVKATDALGGETYTYYDDLGRAVLVRDAEDYLTETTYTAFDEIGKVTRWDHRTTDAASTATRPDPAAGDTGAITSFTYDRAGRLAGTVDAEGFVESFAYNAFGERTDAWAKSETVVVDDGDDNRTSYVYDKRGLLVSETLPMSSVTHAGTVQAQTVTNQYEYDARGNRIRSIEAAGLAEERITTYEYDAADRLIATHGEVRTVWGQTDHEQVSTSFVPTETIEYDARGNVVRTTDAAGNAQHFFYDDLDRKIAEIDALGTVTAYSYDGNGNVASIRIHAQAGSVDTGGNAVIPVPSAGDRVTTFTYDALGRMATSSVELSHANPPVAIGAWSEAGGAWNSTQPDRLTTIYQYDARGNVVKTTDPAGHVVHAYFDALDRKIAQVDGEGYLTTWAYDAEGNVVREVRHANPVGTQNGLTVTVDTAVSALVGSAGYGPDDRITGYTYDQNGNRTSEIRYNVLAFDPGTNDHYALYDASGNRINVAETTSVVTYAYNGLGQVVLKIQQETGDAFGHRYDNAGRLIRELRHHYTGHTGTLVTPKVDYDYDGLGNLTRTEAAGAAGTGARVTQYEFGDGGLLARMTDAEQNAHEYFYDKLGRRIVDRYQRTESDGITPHTEAALTSYDALGRVEEQTVASWSGGAWHEGDVSHSQYNRFGEVVFSGINGLQIENRYDAAGRLWATNAGSVAGSGAGGGVWQYFGYDANGNRTLSVTSAGADLTGKTVAQALGLAGGADVNATYTLYDARGLATKVIEEGRQLSITQVVDLVSTRVYNAFGEVASETDARGATLTYTYSTLGKLVRSESPTVSITNEDGSSQWVKPAEDYYYDLAGRLVATRDANGSYATGGTQANGTSKAAGTGNLTRLTLLAGTGYGGSEALVTQELHADGGVRTTQYDIHGDARKITDEIGRVTTQSFDRLGRVTQIDHAGGLTDYYAYDELGQRTQHWNDFLGAANKELTDYDRQGRVISSRAFGGDVTSTSYAWDGTLEAQGTGLTDVGGWRQTTTMANGRTRIEDSDLFGRTIWKSDLGDHEAEYTYDIAGRLLSSVFDVPLYSLGVLSQHYQYYNIGQLSELYNRERLPSGINPTAGMIIHQGAAYTYDAAGNRLTEHGTTYYEAYDIATVWKEQAATYDLLGRITSITAQATSTAWEYDANGNIRRRTAQFYQISPTGDDGTLENTDHWYRYDAMNRVVVDKGVLSGVAGATGVSVVRNQHGEGSADFLYDEAGQRIATLRTNYQAARAFFDPYYQTIVVIPGSFQNVRESHEYDAAGRIREILISHGTSVLDQNMDGEPDSPLLPAPEGGTRRSSFTYWSNGQLQRQRDFAADGTTVIYDRQNTYNAKNQLTQQFTSTLRSDGKTATSNVTNSYGTGSAYALGAVVSSHSYNTLSGVSASTSRTTSTFKWWDGAVQATSAYDANIYSSSNAVYDTDYFHNALGQLTSMRIADGKPRSVNFTLDERGEVIGRDESRPSNAPSTQAGSPHERWYRFGGREFGYVTNNAGPADMAHEASITDRRYAPPADQGTFRGGRANGRQDADFAQGPAAINSYAQGSAAGGYTVRGGETLQSVAHKLWGDAGLWYKLAEANGLSGQAALIDGQRLTLPAGVMRNTHNAGTFKPYDPADATGELSPLAATPKPPKHGKNNNCGTFGAILLAVVAVAVTVATAGAALSATGLVSGGVFGATGGVATIMSGGMLGAVGLGNAVAIGAGAAAVGSVVSQGVGVATGIQEKFSWKAVGLAAVAGGIGGGLGKSFGAGWQGAAARGMLTNAVTQGIAATAGLQSSFDWAGVAAAGIGAAGHLVAGRLGTGFGANLAANTASGLANAATRSALNGDSFGRNLTAAIPDIVGQAVGSAIGGALARGGPNRSAPENLIPDAFYDPVPVQQPGAQIAADPTKTSMLTTGDIASIDVDWEAVHAVYDLTTPAEDRLHGNSLPRKPQTAGAAPIQQPSVTDLGDASIVTGGVVSEFVAFDETVQTEYRELLARRASATEVIALQAKHAPSGTGSSLASMNAFLEKVYAGEITSGPLGYDNLKEVIFTQSLAGHIAGSEAGALFIGYSGAADIALLTGHDTNVSLVRSANSAAFGYGETAAIVTDLWGMKGLVQAGLAGGIRLSLRNVDAAESAAVRGVSTVETRGGVYLLRDAETGSIVRTGRTKNLARRQAEHARDPELGQYDFEDVFRTDTYAEQRGLEQYLHNQYRPSLNKVNPISPRNPRLNTYQDAAQRYLLEHGVVP